MRDAKGGPRREQRTEETRVFGVGGHDLVAVTDAEARDHDVATVRRRGGESKRSLRSVQQRRDLGAHGLSQGEQLLEQSLTRASFLDETPRPAHGRFAASPRERTEGARIQVRVTGAHRELAADCCQVYAITASIGA